MVRITVAASPFESGRHTKEDRQERNGVMSDNNKSFPEMMNELMREFDGKKSKRDFDPEEGDYAMVDEDGEVIGYLSQHANERIPLIEDEIRSLASQWREKIGLPPFDPAVTTASLVYHLLADDDYDRTTLAQSFAIAVGMIAKMESGNG